MSEQTDPTTAPDVTDQELLDVIATVEREVRAYDAIHSGYLSLAGIPETYQTKQSQGDNAEFRDYYYNLLLDTRIFLSRLHEIRRERGL